MMQRLAHLFAAAAVVVGPLWPAAAAHATTPEDVEHIKQFDVTMTVAPDGLLTVHESIAYDFGSQARHGIFRALVVRETYGNDGRYDRVYRLKVNGVTADGERAQTSESTKGHYLNVRIGDPNRTITGTHTYAIDYTVRGALTTFPNHDELYWDAIGLQWGVPIDRSSVAVHVPAAITRIGCFSGAQGSRLGCAAAGGRGTVATFAQGDLGPGEGVTIVVGFPKGTIQPPPSPILEKRWNLDDAFARRADTVAPALALGGLGVGAVLLLAWRRGRDRRYRGSPVDQAMGNVTGEEEVVPPFAEDAGPVEFVPPDGIRPGEVGVLVDENANVLDVTATIVDLAVRGYLRITELPPEGFLRRRHDYELTRIDGPPPEHRELLPYERKVLVALFKTGPQVKLSELKYKFRTDLTQIRDAMYDDAVTQKWYRARPDRTRAIWHGIGIAGVVAGVALTFLVARTTSYGLVPLGVVLTGLVLLVFANRMPARTGKGTAALSRVRGFRRLFDEGDEDLRSRFAEQHNIFSEYLPY
ncbi:MAG TPA: DUF2207 domain-containing protein, partial [Acidimicrobiia bacterium]|nr:DUF2207 domain-containing protein [Acidimicrobiia bacterium]